MAITQTREVARADMNDEYRVTCWQEAEMVDLTPDEARAYAKEIVGAADEADRVAAEDVGLDAKKTASLIVDQMTGRVVL